MCVTNYQTIASVQLYFHPEVRTYAPYYVRRLPMNAVSLYICALCNTLPPIHEYAYDTKHL